MFADLVLTFLTGNLTFSGFRFGTSLNVVFVNHEYDISSGIQILNIRRPAEDKNQNYIEETVEQFSEAEFTEHLGLNKRVVTTITTEYENGELDTTLVIFLSKIKSLATFQILTKHNTIFYWNKLIMYVVTYDAIWRISQSK